MNKERLFQLIVVTVVLGGFLLMVYNSYSNLDLVKKNLKVARGRVYETNQGGKGGIWVDVVFVVNGKGYTAGNLIYKSYSQADKFKNTYWDVADDSLNPEHNDLLILPEDYKEYNLEYPDSLSWVLGLDGF